MKVLSVLNEKGGVGKTTLASNIARQLQVEGFDVMLVDTDPQGSLRDWKSAAVDSKELPHLIVLDRAELIKEIKEFQDKDWIIVDGAPSVQNILIETIKISDFVLVPVHPSPYDIWAAESLVSMLKAKAEISDTPRSAFIISKQINGTKISAETREVLKEYNMPIFNKYTSQRVVYATSAAKGSTVIDDDPLGLAAKEIKGIVNEILEWKE
jgi:chromosome partitioning protein